MTMRMNAQRNQSNATDADNQPVESWDTLATIPCYAWMRTVRRVSDENKLASVVLLMVLIPSGTDITRNDRVVDITDRLGAVKFTGPYRLDNDPSRRADHLELTLRRAS